MYKYQEENYHSFFHSSDQKLTMDPKRKPPISAGPKSKRARNDFEDDPSTFEEELALLEMVEAEMSQASSTGSQQSMPSFKSTTTGRAPGKISTRETQFNPPTV